MKHVDIETYCELELDKVGVYRYATHQSFRILLAAWAEDDTGEVNLADFTEHTGVEEFEAFIKRPGLFAAHNAAFERIALSYYLPYAGHLKDPRRWRCSLIHGYYLGYPGALGSLAIALGLGAEHLKSASGTRLINKFSKPNGSGQRLMPEDDPIAWEEFKAYCVQDVVSERAISQKLAAFPVPPSVWEAWYLDQTINDRGVGVNRKLYRGAQVCGDYAVRRALVEGQQDYGVNLRSNTVLADRVGLPNVQKETVAAALDGDMPGWEGTPDRVRLLELKQIVSKTSIAKYDSMARAACGSTAVQRLHGMFQFYGAHTGRWTGRLVQLQNLARDMPGIEDQKLLKHLIEGEDVDGLEMLYGSIPHALSGMIRTALIPSAGNKLIAADYSAIEARVTAWLAEERWAMEAFATHGRIYEAAAAQIYNVPFESVSKGGANAHLRQHGKVATLGLGYGMGAQKFRDTARKQGLQLGEEEAESITAGWRAANANIVRFWGTVERRCKMAYTTKRSVFISRTPRIVAGWEQANGLTFLTIELPSGRKLYYPEPRITTKEKQSKRGGDPYTVESLSYMTSNQRRWVRKHTWGGSLVENIVQAVACDVLTNAMIGLDAAGYPVVIHVHDEAVVDVWQEARVDDVCRIMCELPSWAEGLILTAEGGEMDWYRKM